ncbi:MAG: signal peptidase I [Thermodesulfobacteria bacterium]|nr:signal peptidase I [Thermodesulfobacteriota bacterium]
MQEVKVVYYVIDVSNLFLTILTLIGMWKVFEKANQPGWASMIPIYNTYILIKIAKKPGWWILLYLIPLVNLIIALIVSINVAKNFGKSTAFGLGLTFLPFIFFPILGFGEAKYIS